METTKGKDKGRRYVQEFSLPLPHYRKKSSANPILHGNKPKRDESLRHDRREKKEKNANNEINTTFRSTRWIYERN